LILYFDHNCLYIYRQLKSYSLTKTDPMAMKKIVPVLLAICFLTVNTASSQGILGKVRSAVKNEISGNKTGNTQAKTQPDPKCACNDAKMVVDLTRFQIPYNEISFYFLDDGSILIFDRMSQKYYISKDGNLEGPFDQDNQRVKDFQKAAGQATDDSEDDARGKDYWLLKYPSWVSRSGDKYVIKFGGKTYGPFAVINEFAVPRSNEIFAAMVTENVAVTENDSKKMEAAIKNAKTDQERMELAMKFSQQMSKQMMDGGGPTSILPKLVTNVAGAKYDQMEWMGGKLNGSVKYDEIVVVSPQKVIDLQGKTLLTFKDYSESSNPFFLSSSNQKTARYTYGSLVFSDNTTLADLFNPYMVGTGGKTYLTYMYYSPSKNAIMQCQIPF